MERTNFIKRGLLQAAILGFLSVVATQPAVSQDATTSKLYFNKSVSDDNFILLSGDLSATVSHTAEGLELEIPGVEITLSCSNTNQSTDDPAETCTVEIGAGSSNDNDDSNNDDSNNDDSNNDDSNNDDSNNDDSNNDDSNNDDSSNDDSDNDSGNTTGDKCGDRVGPNTVSCKSSNYGPAGGDYTAGVSKPIKLSGGKVDVYKFTLKSSTVSGSIGIVPRLSGTKFKNEGTVKIYLSEEPADPSLVKADRYCAAGGKTATIKYGTTGKSGECELEAGKRYYVNLTSCTTADLLCKSKRAKAATGSATMYIITN